MSVESPVAAARPSDSQSVVAGRTSWPLLGAGLAVVLALLAGLVLGRATAGPAADFDRVDVGFAQDMKVHHAQAVAMSAPVHERSQDREVAALALDILTTQQAQIGMMGGWLEQWGQTQAASGPTMGWMGDAHSGPMPGMATPDEVAALRTLPAGELEEHFLRLMVRHHAGAVPMASYAAAEGDDPSLVRLAGGMVAGQQAEIDVMQDLLVARGHAPEPVADLEAHGHGVDGEAGHSHDG